MKPAPSAPALFPGGLRPPSFDTFRRFGDLRALSPFIVLAVSVLVYANAVTSGFVLDDQGVIATNPLVHSLEGLWRAFTSTYWPPEHGAGLYRPLVIVTFVVDWAVSGGNPWLFHSINVLWHALACVAVWRLLDELASPAAALAGAVIFAVHPVHVEAVASIVGRADVMATFFTVMALLAHRRRSLLAPLLFALGLLSKESAITFIALAVLHDLLLSRQSARSAFRSRAVLYAAYGAILMAYALVLFAVFRGERMVVPAITWIGATTFERLLTVGVVIPECVRLLLVPLRLSIDYTPAVVELQTGVTAAAVAGWLLAASVLAGAIAAWRRAPRVSFALLFIPVTLAPVANVVFASGIVLAERTLYLPSVGLVLLLALLGDYLLAPRAATPKPEPGLQLPVLMAALLLVVALYSVRTWTRTPVWRSSTSLIGATLREHPQSYKAHQVWGRALSRMGDLNGAAREYSIATAIYQRDAVVYAEAAQIRTALGQLLEAAALLDTALSLSPAPGQHWLTLAELRYRLGEHAHAVAAGERAIGAAIPLSSAADSVRAAVVIVAAAKAAGDPEAAGIVLRRVLARAPGLWLARSSYADLLLVQGEPALALEHARAAAAASGGHEAARAVLARASAAASRAASDPARSAPPQ